MKDGIKNLAKDVFNDPLKYTSPLLISGAVLTISGISLYKIANGEYFEGAKGLGLAIPSSIITYKVATSGDDSPYKMVKEAVF